MWGVCMCVCVCAEGRKITVKPSREKRRRAKGERERVDSEEKRNRKARGENEREREGEQQHNAGDSLRTPQTLSHLFCSWRFVGFLPLDGKTTVVAAASQSRVALKLLKWKRVCHSHYVRLSLVAATAFSPSHPPFPSHSGYPSLFSHFSLCRAVTLLLTSVSPSRE